jgi:hypothetical protein
MMLMAICFRSSVAAEGTFRLGAGGASATGIGPISTVMATVAAMSTVAAVHEYVHQRARQQNEPR